MNLKIKITLLLLFVFLTELKSQIQSYKYQRSLINIEDNWHIIAIPIDLYDKISISLNDIRIYGIKENNDTIEVPYILSNSLLKNSKTALNHKIINQTSKSKSHYFTIQLSNNESINEIKLDFKNENFDWKINLEGSNDQKEWFTILQDYRILSIKNLLSNFQFGTLKFTDSNFQYYRIEVKSNEKPILSKVNISEAEKTSIKTKQIALKNQNIIENKESKSTEIEIELANRIPLSSLKISVKDDIDFYRKIQFLVLSDSLKTEKGWKYIHNTVKTDVLHSFDNNEFNFKDVISNKFKIIIDNQDNEALKIDSIEVFAFDYEIIARFNEKAEYYLCYGKASDSSPKYDITAFLDKIPNDLNYLKLGGEFIIDKPEPTKKKPLFENENWLWILIITSIAIMGGFSFKMLRNV
jgi:hypothetical protein